jgi:N6-L-threonylcarbamoyladenine synthase
VIVLGLETSCDETAAALVRDGTVVLADIVATQHDLHDRYKGVVPEIASRAHVERILPVVREALATAGIGYGAVDGLAVGHRPGLIGSLLVGTTAAKALAWSLGKPFVGVDHVAAHLAAGLLEAAPCAFPAIGLVVSGGHTSLFLVHDPLRLERLGATVDDAIGEAYDKAATILGLGYPGGPALDALAQTGDDRAHDFPIPRLGRDGQGRPRLDFSFSGLKTALLYAARGVPERGGGFARTVADLDQKARADLAASFQRAAVGAILRNLTAAIERHPVPTLLVGGGASANSRLRTELAEMAGQRGLDLRLPRPRWCLDNAAMIAGYGAFRLAAGERDPLSLAAQPLSALP